MRAGYARLDLSASTDRFAANAGLAADLLGIFAGARSEPVPGIRAVLVAITWTTLVLAVGWRVLRGRPDRLAFACLFALAGLGVLSTYLLTYDDIKIHYGVYYLLVPYAALVCAAAAVDEPNATRGSRLAARVAMMVLLVAGIANAAWASVQGTSGYRGISKNQLVSRDARVELLAWLREQGLQRGYANFWDANAITLESGGEVRVTSTLTPRGGRPLRRHSWLQEADRYEFNPGADGARWFIAIPRRRTAVRLPDACRPTAWEGEVGAYRVYVYERPMPDCIPPATAGERRHGGSPTRKPGD
jgi:hypothetical protein